MAKKSNSKSGSKVSQNNELTLEQLDQVAGGSGPGVTRNNDMINDSQLTQPNALQPTPAPMPGAPAPIVTGTHIGGDATAGGTNFDAHNDMRAGISTQQDLGGGVTHTAQTGIVADTSFRVGVTGVTGVAGTHAIATSSVDVGDGVVGTATTRGDAGVYGRIGLSGISAGAETAVNASVSATQSNNADAGHGMTAHNATTVETGVKAEANAHMRLTPTNGNMTVGTTLFAGSYVSLTESVSVDGHGVGVGGSATLISAGGAGVGFVPTLGEQDGKYNIGLRGSLAVGIGGLGGDASISLDKNMVDGAVVSGAHHVADGTVYVAPIVADGTIRAAHTIAGGVTDVAHTVAGGIAGAANAMTTGITGAANAVGNAFDNAAAEAAAQARHAAEEAAAHAKAAAEKAAAEAAAQAKAAAEHAAAEARAVAEKIAADMAATKLAAEKHAAEVAAAAKAAQEAAARAAQEAAAAAKAAADRAAAETAAAAKAAADKLAAEKAAAERAAEEAARQAATQMNNRVVKPGISAVSGGASKSGDLISVAGNTVYNGVTNAANTVARGVSSVGSAIGSFFCHTAGTLIAMSDGTFKPVEQLVIGDDVLLGGKVTSRLETPSTDFYSHRGTVLTGQHAVFEDGRWLRVEHSPLATRLEDQSARLVYPVWTEKHLLVCEQYICSDFAECDGGIGDDAEGLAIKLGMLNADTARNRELSAAAERFGFAPRRAA